MSDDVLTGTVLTFFLSHRKSKFEGHMTKPEGAKLQTTQIRPNITLTGAIICNLKIKEPNLRTATRQINIRVIRLAALAPPTFNDLSHRSRFRYKSR